MPERISAGPADLVRWDGSLAAGHAAAFAVSEPTLRDWMPSAAAEQEDSEAFIEACIGAFDEGTTYSYAVVTGEVVGYCNATPRSEVAEIAYWVRSDLAGAGLGSVVARALVEAVFGALRDVRRIEAHIDEANAASRRVAEKVGMRIIGTRTRDRRTSAETPIELIFAVERG